MAPIYEIITASHLEGALAIFVLWLFFKTIDRALLWFFNEKILSKILSKITKKAKALWTKRDHIKADFEFSADLNREITVQEGTEKTDQLLQILQHECNGKFEKTENWEKSEMEQRIRISPTKQDEPYIVDFNFIPDPTDPKTLDAPLSSIGVHIEFEFAFGDLRGAIINLTSFANFLKKALRQTYPVVHMSNSRFVVSPIDNNLTLDDWIHKQQLDVSLLLQSPENERRSVRFYGDRAEITSPHENVDDATVEYIRATLLNYYL